MPTANPPTLCLALSAMLFLIVGKELINPLIKKMLGLTIPLPFELITVILSTIFSSGFNLFENYHVKIVNNIPTG